MIVLSAVAIILLGVIAYASIPSENRLIYACYKKSGGSLRVIDKSVTTCGKDETQISWNQQGPPGPQGAQGEEGPPVPLGPPDLPGHRDPLDLKGRKGQLGPSCRSLSGNWCEYLDKLQ